MLLLLLMIMMMVVVVVVMMMTATMIMMIIKTTMIMVFWDLHTCSTRSPVNGQNFDRRFAQNYIGLRNSALHAWKAGDGPRRTSHHASHGVEAGPNGR